jgi:hypothetical protein
LQHYQHGGGGEETFILRGEQLRQNLAIDSAEYEIEREGGQRQRKHEYQPMAMNAQLGLKIVDRQGTLRIKTWP